MACDGEVGAQRRPNSPERWHCKAGLTAWWIHYKLMWTFEIPQVPKRPKLSVAHPAVAAEEVAAAGAGVAAAGYALVRRWASWCEGCTRY